LPNVIALGIILCTHICILFNGQEFNLFLLEQLLKLNDMSVSDPEMFNGIIPDGVLADVYAPSLVPYPEPAILAVNGGIYDFKALDVRQFHVKVKEFIFLEQNCSHINVFHDIFVF
jgi:hypothetical protein